MTIDSEEMISTVQSKVGHVEGSSLSPFSLILQRPLGIGFTIGLIIGLANAIVLGLPLLMSMGTGILIGVFVCIIGCPAMKNQLAQRRELEKSRKTALARRTRIISAFTSLD
jgi:uncharacterized membrane-anchored protein YhcB (DUF1043 family)